MVPLILYEVRGLCLVLHRVGLQVNPGASKIEPVNSLNRTHHVEVENNDLGSVNKAGTADHRGPVSIAISLSLNMFGTGCGGWCCVLLLPTCQTQPCANIFPLRLKYKTGR